MPEMDGIEATKAIRRLPSCSRFQLPVIAMTAHSDSREVAACFAVGMNDHTLKPIAVGKLFAALLRWAPLRPEQAAGLAPLLEAVGALSQRLRFRLTRQEKALDRWSALFMKGVPLSCARRL